MKLTPPAHWRARLQEAGASADTLPRMMRGAAGIVVLWLLAVLTLAGLTALLRTG